MATSSFDGFDFLIYTTPARLLNALALRGYFREAASKKGSGRSRKDRKIEGCSEPGTQIARPKTTPERINENSHSVFGLLKRNEIEIERPLSSNQTRRVSSSFASLTFRRSNVLPLTA